MTFIDNPLKTVNCRMKRKYTFVNLRGDSGCKFSTEKNRHTNAKSKWIRKENWLIQIGCENLKLSKSTFRMQLAPSCKFKMVMPVQNYKFVCSCFRILTWQSNES